MRDTPSYDTGMIAIIIPTLDAAPFLSKLLEQLDHREDRVIVSDGGSRDDSLEISAKNGCQIALGSPSRGAQLRRGIKLAADADWYLFLHADCYLPGNWRQLIVRHIENHPDKAAFFSLKFDSPKLGARWTELMVAWRSWTFIWGWALPYGDQGLLISRELYHEIGGYPNWPIFEDVRIVEKIGRRRIRPLGGNLITSAAKFERDGFLRRGWRNFRLLRRYKKGESIENLMKAYT